MHMVIRTPDQRLRVFVSSTLGEMARERKAVYRSISALRLTPVMFELGARPHPPRELYQAYLAQSDVFIGLYWQRYGQPGPGMTISGVEEEFELARGMPRLLYLKSPAPHREPRLADLLARVEAEAIGEVADLLTRPDVRLVTLTGPGGIGKTRLATAVGERLGDQFGSGSRAVFVPLDSVTQPELALAAIGRALGANLSETTVPLEALAEHFDTDQWLLILDNLEQVVAVAADIAQLLVRCPGLAMLGTSRTALGLQAEHEYPVGALPLPPSSGAVPTAELEASPAVELFVARASAVRPGFAITSDNAAAIADICRLLEGLPLAIELAAARTRMLEPAELRDRLSRSLDALGTGAADLPERQRTLRATVEWSTGLLDPAELSLLQVLAAFVDGWSTEAVASVAAIDEDQALELSEALARHSFIQLDSTRSGLRPKMLETIRVFVTEQLAERPDAEEVRARHADYYRTLAERAGRPLRVAGGSEWADRLDAEDGNIAAAVGWYLDHDAGRLPRLFRELLPLWALKSNDLSQLRSWVDQLLPTADSMATEARTELWWAAAVTAREVGDNAAALAARERLAPLLEQIHDRYLRAVCELAMAWTSAIVGDAEAAVQRAAASLEELGELDEPFWTATALLSLGSVETATGRYRDALGHLRKARELAGQLGNIRLMAGSTVQLGTLAVMRGRPEEAWALLDQGIDLSVANHSARNLILILGDCAELIFEAGDPERAALLMGAADGLRQRAGLRAWPTTQRGPAELVAQIRDALGTERRDRAFAAGSRLSVREATAAVREHPAFTARNS
jgi:predicted ATPase